MHSNSAVSLPGLAGNTLFVQTSQGRDPMPPLINTTLPSNNQRLAFIRSSEYDMDSFLLSVYSGMAYMKNSV